MIFTTFGDAMRVPGSKKSLLQAKADGADVRMVYSPMDALALARKNPDREVVFFGIGFETTMPSTALTVLQAERGRHREFLGVLQPHHHRADDQGDPRQARSAARRLSRPRPCLHGDRHRALSCSSRNITAARWWSRGFEPLDVLQSIWMVLQADQGRPRRGGEPVCAHRAGRGQRGGARRRCRRCSSCASSSNGAGSARSTIPA